MFGEFVSPEVRVRSALIDPVRVHPVEQVVLLECLDKCRYGRTLVRWNCRAIWQSVSRIGRWRRIVLTIEIAVLSVAAVAEIGP